MIQFVLQDSLLGRLSYCEKVPKRIFIHIKKKLKTVLHKNEVHPVTKGTSLITRIGSEPTNRKHAKRWSLSLALTVSIGLVLKSLDAFLF